MADVTLPQVCVSLQAGGRCCLLESPCPFAPESSGGEDGRWEGCQEARFAARVHLAPDEFVVLVGTDGRPKRGRFPLRRCRVTAVEESVGVHTSSLLTSRGDAALLDEIELPGGTVMLTTRDGNASLMWKQGKFVPA